MVSFSSEEEDDGFSLLLLCFISESMLLVLAGAGVNSSSSSFSFSGVGGAVGGNERVGRRGVVIGVRASEPNWASRKRKRRSRRSVGVRWAWGFRDGKAILSS